MMTAKSF